MIQSILVGLAPVITSLGQAAGSFGGAFLTLFQGALPFIQAFAVAIANVGAAFSTWATGFVQSGGLATFLQEAWAAGSKLWQILLNVGSILGSLFGGSVGLGSALLTTIEEITGRFADFLNSVQGQDEMRQFFADAGQRLALLGTILTNLGGLIGPIISAVSRLGLVFLTALSQINFSGLGEGLTPIFDVIIANAQKFLPIVVDVVNTVIGLIQSLAPVWAGVAAVMGAGIERIGAIIGPLLEGLRSQFPAIAEAAGHLGEALSKFAESAQRQWSLLAPVLQPVLELLGRLVGGALVSGLTVLAGLLEMVAGNMSGDFLGAFAGFGQVIAGLIMPIEALITGIIGLFTNLPGAAGAAVQAFVDTVTGIFQALYDFLIGNSLIPDLITGIIGWFASLPGAIIGAIGDLAGAFAGWVAGVAGVVAGVISSVISQFAGLAGRVISAAGSLLSSFASWVSGIPGRAAALIGQILSQFTGLASRIIAAAGNLASQAATWFMGMVTAAASIPGKIISYFTGLAGRIMDAIGTLSFGGIFGAAGLIAGAARGIIAGAASGVEITRGPQLRIIGEAGPEAVVPLRRNQTLDPQVESLLLSVAANRGMTGERPAIPPIQVMLPTGDPEAAAMAVWNRIAFEGAH